MNIQFTQNAWEEFSYWLETDAEVVEKISNLIKEIKQNPFKGPGKPEPLRYSLQGYW
jgi:toxin YoeB